ncbi:MAG TPA: YHS domain-containing protein [Verrucomicrobiae bacterium]|jgi:YHS domain-containing protein|nr:YHS domain-containing protein [Verrucomicrobiae bacterium]
MKSFAIVLALVFSATGALAPAALAVGEEAGGVLDVQNKFCPVDHKPVDQEHSVVYDGKLYHVCSARCESKFNKDPKTYAAKVILPSPGGQPGVNADSAQEAKKLTEGQ